MKPVASEEGIAMAVGSAAAVGVMSGYDGAFMEMTGTKCSLYGYDDPYH